MRPSLLRRLAFGLGLAMLPSSLVQATGAASNTLEGGTAGTTVTSANSGGTSGDAFDVVTIGFGNTVTYSSTAAHGSDGVNLTTSGGGLANVAWTATVGSLTTHYGRLYLYTSANPPANVRIFTATGGGSLRGSIQLGSNGKLRTFDANNSLVATTTNTIPLSTWIRVEWKVVGAPGTGGSFAMKYYSSKDNTTPTETLSNTGLNTGGSVDTYKFGTTTSVSNTNLTMDDLAISQTAYPGPAVGYYNEVGADSPVAYWRLGEISGTTVNDSSGSGYNGTYNNSPTLGGTGALTSDNDKAPTFDGLNDYAVIGDQDAFSRPGSGAITVEAWIRPDSLSMPDQEGSGYVYILGKGGPGQHEWVMRMYQTGNSEGRENRISFYAFNLSGGLGVGSYFQDTVIPGEWIHVVGVINQTQTKMYKNGVLRDSDNLDQLNITPGNGTAPVRIGTRDFNSFFEGGIDEVTIYNTELSASRIQAHYNAARSAAVFGAGSVPDGRFVEGTPLTVSKTPSGDVELVWGASCLISDTDYAIYEGSLGNFASHASRFCTTGGMRAKVFTPASGNSYYLIVPTHADREGFYGNDSAGHERPQGQGACYPQLAEPCLVGF